MGMLKNLKLRHRAYECAYNSFRFAARLRGWRRQSTERPPVPRCGISAWWSFGVEDRSTLLLDAPTFKTDA